MKYNENVSPEANVNKQFNKMYESKKMPTERRLELDVLIKKKVNESLCRESFDDVHSHQTYEKESSQSLFDKVVDYWSDFFSNNVFKSVALLGGSSFAMLIMIMVVGYYLFDFNSIDDFDYSESPVRIQATESTALGASQDTRFIISAELDLDTNELEKSIIVEPVFEYSLKENDGKIEIVPEDDLYQETNYSITIPKDTMIGGVMLEEDFVWEFVTEPKFTITNFVFQDNDESLDDEGDILEFTSNYDDVDLDSFEERFYSIPNIEIQEIKQVGYKVIVTSEYPLRSDTDYKIAIDNGLVRKGDEIMETPYLVSFHTDVVGDDGKVEISFADQYQNQVYPAVNNSGKIDIDILDTDFSLDGNQVTIYHVDDFASNDDVFELFKKSQYFDTFDVIDYDTLSLHEEYMLRDLSYEISTEGKTTVSFEYSGLQKGELYVVRVMYKGEFIYRYMMWSEIVGHVTTLQNELVIVGFDKTGNLLQDANVKLYYRTYDNTYDTLELELDAQTVISNDDIQNALAIVLMADDDKSLIMLDQGDNGLVTNSDLYISSSSYQNNVLVYTKFDKPAYVYGDTIQFKSIFKATDDLVDFSTFDVNGVEFSLLDNDGELMILTPKRVSTEHSYIIGEFILPENIDYDDYNSRIEFKKDGINIGFAEYEIYELESLFDDMPSPDEVDIDDPVSDVYDRDGNLLYEIPLDESTGEIVEPTENDVEIRLSKDIYTVGDVLDIEILANTSDVLDDRPIIVSLIKDELLVSQIVSLNSVSQTVSFALGDDAPPISYISVVYADFDKEIGYMEVVNLEYKIVTRQPEKEITLNIEVVKSDDVDAKGSEVKIQALDFEGYPVQNQNLTIRIFDKALLSNINTESYGYRLYEKMYDTFDPNIKYSYFPSQLTSKENVFAIDPETKYINEFVNSGYFEFDLVTDENGEVIAEIVLPVVEDGDIEWIVDVEMITDDFSVGNGILVAGVY